jgi:hypothetical protein
MSVFGSVQGMWSVLEVWGFLATVLILLALGIILEKIARVQVRSWRLQHLTALAVGGAAFAHSIAMIQVPLQEAANRWLAATFATANPLLTSIPAISLSGIVQESTKLLLALALTTLWRTRAADRGGVGAALGAGYGGMEAWIVMSMAFSAGYGGAAVLPAALERLIVVPLHASLTFIAASWWNRRGAAAGLLALAGVSLHHALVNYGTVALRAGLTPGLTSIVGSDGANLITGLAMMAYLAVLTAGSLILAKLTERMI